MKVNSAVLTFAVLASCLLWMICYGVDRYLLVFIFPVLAISNRKSPNKGLVIIAASLFYLALNTISLLLVNENYGVNQIFHTFSDDWVYLKLAAGFRDDLIGGRGIVDSIKSIADSTPYIGYPLMLGAISYLLNISTQDGLALFAIHLNIYFAWLVGYILCIYILEKKCMTEKSAYLGLLVLFFPLVSLASQVRKDCLIILSIFYFSVLISEDHIYTNYKSYLCLLVLFFLRPIYALVIIGGLLWAEIVKIKSISNSLKYFLIILSLCLIAALALLVFSNIFINYNDFKNILFNRSEISETNGIASMIYNIPYIGPYVYFALSPFPITKWFGANLSEYFESLGSLLMYLSYFYLGIEIFRGKLSREAYYWLMIMVIIISLAAAGAYEPRHKYAMYPFLSMIIAYSFNRRKVV